MKDEKKKHIKQPQNQDLLKVIKLNKDICDETLLTVECLNEKAQKHNDENDELIANIEKQFGIKAPEIILPQRTLKVDVPTSSWDELVKDVNHRYPQSLGFDDLLTPEEINEVCRNIDRINEEFSKKTRLRRHDWIFLATATALQCIRQYLLDPWLKEKRVTTGKNDEKNHKLNGDPGWYYVSTDKIITNKVPFDAQKYNPANPSVAKFLAGAKDHRYVTLGHDPILGWIFGTVNIMTSTITRYDMATAHVKYQPSPVIHSLADNGKMATAVSNRVLNDGFDGKTALAFALGREAIHLRSDINTKDSLPIPVISTLSPRFAEKLAGYGIDTASVGTEASISLIINMLISIIHKMFYDESIDDAKLYEVRTRKILLYSNLFASSSNLIVTALTKDVSKLDVGGLIVTISRLFSDIRFITKVKQDFINSQLDIQFKGISDELDELYKNEIIVSF